ncbi:hypothetical protein SGLAM104S_01860 [Streptomyces glaucescens]
MKAETLRGNLEGMLLSVLEPGELHGYAVIEELKRRSGDAINLPTGTVYPALHRLEASRPRRQRVVPPQRAAPPQLLPHRRGPPRAGRQAHGVAGVSRSSPSCWEARPGWGREFLEGYTDRLAKHLVGDDSRRAAILDEVMDGLQCAAEGNLQDCSDAEEAARRAVREWGPPGEVARAYNDATLRLSAQRLSLRAVCVLPLLAATWATALLGEAGTWRCVIRRCC